MTDQTNGLRFDVYERVHLPDDVAAIDELEEIELVPRIQVIDHGDQAILKGQLLLSGVYRGQNAADAPLTLEHWIPVEISLPMNRVSRLDDISVEIDNFDVDLLSSRTLNITGVLSLRGISVDPIQEQNESWNEDSFTAVHQRELYTEQALPEDGEELETATFEQPYISFTESAEAVEEAREIALSAQQTSEDSWLASSSQYVNFTDPAAYTVAYPQSEAERMEQDRQQVLEEEFEQEQEQEQEQDREQEVEQELELEQQLEVERDEEALENDQAVEYEHESHHLFEVQREPALESQQLLESQRDPIEDLQLAQQQQSEMELVSIVEQEPKKKEMQIAFVSKVANADETQQSSVGLTTLLQSSKREQAAREAAKQIVAEQQQAEEEARTQIIEEEIEWKKLFLNKRDDEREFRKIRVCIVQREETLEKIAMRYSLNPRELLVHNRLQESSISEGQLLYIPSR